MLPERPRPSGRNVPASPSGRYKLGGYQVLKKWLSYRERAILDRPLLPDEVQHFTDAARRIAAILLTVGAGNAWTTEERGLRSRLGRMADDHAADQPQSPDPQPPVSQRHDKYFYRVFSDLENAAGLLRSYLPQELARTLRWSTLTHRPSRFVGDDWRGREADLLFSVERELSGPPVLVLVLLEHQSTPDRWMRLRLLHYCLMAWMQWHREHEQEPQLPLIVPVVFYQGAEPWRFSRQFAELVAGAESAPGWVPQFEHLLIDQTEQSPSRWRERWARGWRSSR